MFYFINNKYVFFPPKMVIERKTIFLCKNYIKIYLKYYEMRL